MTTPRPYLSGVGIAALRRIAAEVLPDDAFAYYSTGARDEVTLRANEAAWGSWFLVPRVLVDTREATTATSVLGIPVDLPVMVAPMAAQSLAHPGAELETARAAAAAGAVMILSMNASVPVEQIAAVPGIRCWMQLYLPREPATAAALVDRARAAGASAIVLTVDSVLEQSTHRRPHGDVAMPSFVTFPMNDLSPMDDGLDWAAVERFIASCPLPVVLKGILSPADAVRAVDAGCAALIVSNHGGRQVDGTLPTAELLPEVVDAVGGAVEVYVDGGIRRGADVLRALALGARAVLVGRPVLWGLAAAGEAGVGHVLGLLRHELLQDARLCGIGAMDAVPRDLVRRSTTVVPLPPAEPLRGR